MEPMVSSKGTLVDLLDRVLDRGIIINADIIISLAGVPLIGVNLRAALAGMETMVKYGIMNEWDQRIRSQALESAGTPQGLVVAEDELPVAVASTVSGA